MFCVASAQNTQAQSNAKAPPSLDDIGRRLIAAYPSVIAGFENGELIWKDGSRSKLDDGTGQKDFATWLDRADIEDMFQKPYITGAITHPPEKDDDPGRSRNGAFFDKLYGNCHKGETAKNLIEVAWLPKKGGGKLRFNARHGAAKALEAVSLELDALPSSFDIYLLPSAGTFVCRTIAGTTRTSAHGHGIAIDIATAKSHYWQWEKRGADGALTWKNSIPNEIVAIFEKHGFVWGGKWYHYDTMHFEYRPELVQPKG